MGSTYTVAVAAMAPVQALTLGAPSWSEKQTLRNGHCQFPSYSHAHMLTQHSVIHTCEFWITNLLLFLSCTVLGALGHVFAHPCEGVRPALSTFRETPPTVVVNPSLTYCTVSYTTV